MQSQDEDSLLTSLRELRGIEENRLLEEADARQQAAEAARQAVEAEERRAREAEAQRARDAEEIARRRAEDEERQRREDALRLDEAERRARVDAQMRLQQERLRLEVEAEAIHGATQKPMALMVIAWALTIAVLGLGGYAYTAHRRSVAQVKAMEAAEDARKGAEAKLQHAIAEQHAAEQALRDAKTETERLEAQWVLDQKTLELTGLSGGDPTILPALLPPPTHQAVHTPLMPPVRQPIMICPDKRPMCSDAEKIPAAGYK